MNNDPSSPASSPAALVLGERRAQDHVEHMSDLRSLFDPAVSSVNKELIALPEQYRADERVRGKLFFTLPTPLLDAVVRGLGEDKNGKRMEFDPAEFEIEYALSRACGVRPDIMGFWGGEAISYPFLRRLGPLNLSKEDEVLFGKTIEQVQIRLDVVEPTLEWAWTVARAYAGWLLSNRAFLKEHHALFLQWKDQVSQWGIPQLGSVMQAGAAQAATKNQGEPKLVAFTAAFEEFFLRWRLRGLAAPYLPIPLQPLLAREFPATILGQLFTTGALFYVPDTFPVPSRDQFRRLLDDSLRGGETPEHLQEWHQIVRRGNFARNQLPRFARLFEIQHYWKVLHWRHAAALHRKSNEVKRAIATCLQFANGGSQEDPGQIVYREVRYLNKRLGANWFAAPGCQIPDIA